MKFLEYTPLARINSFWAMSTSGDASSKVFLEAYSCKLAGTDKNFPGVWSKSRRTLIYLILTLNHMYPDYDFSMLQPHHFSKEQGVSAAKQKIDQYLLEATKIWATDLGEETPLVECIWSAIDEVMRLEECDVYSYMPDVEGDPFADIGTIWSFNYFFYNKKLKRILYFSSRCLSKSIDESSSDDGVSEEDLDFTEGMDLEE